MSGQVLQLANSRTTLQSALRHASASLRLREQHEELHVGDGAARHRRLQRRAAQRVARLPGALAAQPHASAPTTDQDLEGTNSATGKHTVHADCVQQARSVNALLWRYNRAAHSECRQHKQACFVLCIALMGHHTDAQPAP